MILKDGDGTFVRSCIDEEMTAFPQRKSPIK